jgi:hypothetical protein
MTIELNEVYTSGKIHVSSIDDFGKEETNYLLPILFLLSIFTFYYIYQTYVKYEKIEIETVLSQIEDFMQNGIEWSKTKMNELLLFLHTDKGAITNHVSE